jgi:hypothetical protein
MQRQRARARKIGGSRNIHQAAANGVDHEFGSFVNSEGIHDIGTVNGDSVRAQVSIDRNFFVRLARDDQF